MFPPDRSRETWFSSRREGRYAHFRLKISDRAKPYAENKTLEFHFLFCEIKNVSNTVAVSLDAKKISFPFDRLSPL